jgi:hypothetical protein
MQSRKPDRNILTEQLLQVEDRIALCRTHIDRQHAEIELQIEIDGDPAPARRLLGEIHNLLSLNIIERNRLQSELDKLSD